MLRKSHRSRRRLQLRRIKWNTFPAFPSREGFRDIGRGKKIIRQTCSGSALTHAPKKESFREAGGMRTVLGGGEGQPAARGAAEAILLPLLDHAVNTPRTEIPLVLPFLLLLGLRLSPALEPQPGPRLQQEPYHRSETPGSPRREIKSPGDGKGPYLSDLSTLSWEPDL